MHKRECRDADSRCHTNATTQEQSDRCLLAAIVVVTPPGEWDWKVSRSVKDTVWLKLKWLKISHFERDLHKKLTICRELVNKERLVQKSVN